MKDVGIITCGKEPNYGACLQAFATQLVIEELGFSCEMLNYSFMDDKEYRHFLKSNLRATVSGIVHYQLRKGLHFAFESFRNRYMRYYSEKLKNPSDFDRIKNRYKIFLVGSDQVWNPFLGIDTTITLLDFYHDGPKRVSYASSFGIAELPNEVSDKYKAALGKFDAVSVREYAGAEIVRKLLGKDVPVVLDPTMLIDNSRWEQFEEKYDIDQPYILIYDMNHASLTVETAIRLSELTGFKIVALSRIILPHKKRIHTLHNVSPSNFLWLIRNAEFVVTDSFHGMQFSINLHKKFYSICTREGEKIKTRITGFLESINLTDRLIESSKDVDIEKIIDYKRVDKLLNERRTESINYLKEALS